MGIASDLPEIDYAADQLDLDPVFAALHADGPVHAVRLNGQPVWLITGLREGRSMLADPRFSRARAVGRNPRGGVRREEHLPDMDPPEHTRQRGHLTGWFTGRRVERLRPRAEAITAGLLDVMASRPAPVDLVEHLSLPLPIAIISELLGVPVADRDQFTGWADAFLSISGFTPREVADAHRGLKTYLTGLVAQRRREPTDDLLGSLVHARDENGSLSESELVSLASGLLVAGYETTAGSIANLIYTLLTNRALWQHILDDPGNLSGAIEELLRYVPLGTELGMPRVTTEDVEIGGQVIPADSVVFAARSVASRDPAVYQHPTEIDFGRDAPLPHLAFGHGIHHCVGALLARMELEVAIGGLRDRFPGLRLGVRQDEVRWKSGLLIRGPRDLPVTW